jgi:DNA-binding transcriptional regulator YhcF (GntR family)
MTYKIKRKVISDYIPLSDKIEKDLDKAYFVKTEQEQMIKQLKKAGHSEDRIKQILEEVKQSSNPNYILNYYGVKNIKK